MRDLSSGCQKAATQFQSGLVRPQCLFDDEMSKLVRLFRDDKGWRRSIFLREANTVAAGALGFIKRSISQQNQRVARRSVFRKGSNSISIRARSRSATNIAPSRSACGKMIENSSPPYRAGVSTPRNSALKVSA